MTKEKPQGQGNQQQQNNPNAAQQNNPNAAQQNMPNAAQQNKPEARHDQRHADASKHTAEEQMQRDARPGQAAGTPGKNDPAKR